MPGAQSGCSGHDTTGAIVHDDESETGAATCLWSKGPCGLKKRKRQWLTVAPYALEPVSISVSGPRAAVKTCKSPPVSGGSPPLQPSIMSRFSAHRCSPPSPSDPKLKQAFEMPRTVIRKRSLPERLHGVGRAAIVTGPASRKSGGELWMNTSPGVDRIVAPHTYRNRLSRQLGRAVPQSGFVTTSGPAGRPVRPSRRREAPTLTRRVDVHHHV